MTDRRSAGRRGDGFAEERGHEVVAAGKSMGVKQRRTFSHSLWTSTSASCLQFIKLSIHPSSVGMVAGSRLAGASSAGTRPTSSMFVSILAIVVRKVGDAGSAGRGKGGCW